MNATNINIAPTSTSASTIAPATPAPGIGSMLVIASCTAFLMVTSSVAVWSQIEPVILLVARAAS